MKIWPGNPYPLGATFDGSGTNFSIFSEAADRIELCLFDDEGHGFKKKQNQMKAAQVILQFLNEHLK